VDEIPEWAKYFLGVKIQNFSSASNREFSMSEPKTPSSAGFTGKSGIFWLRRATTSREIGMSARILVIWCLICHFNRKPRRLTRRSRATSPQSCAFFTVFAGLRLALHFDLQPEKIKDP
jgi:hypothetical protein